MDSKASMDEMRDQLRNLNRALPDQTRGFGAMQKSIKEGGVLGVKEKEFVALGIAIATRCMPCIEFHVEALMKTGASREEMADVCAMAINMAGGPGLMYAAKAMAVWDQLAEG
ncbi:carboxymuconolactone decarboxylase family protein [Paracoccus sp. R12_1]|jgi:AhpD family alkylhydroperoxidase|uniref:carboxymuconolactone decarboxylase family protein n=1 Tax=unclassified Paracoccus (in: a-proteobacteria) TaxID=2688777 RepID=UPI001ADB7233|nr:MULTISPECIES: carboxymuconolactone decarboxylase family protein [unclassified Paracoccus (in: a-proteobacteria)]MBO9453922.1 carboxymuconolactone decarboxylase family protein [Paracoccus sp. R12_2]MBO9485730.1 carboxymuconolactone decarboxylase family protein [Paracoccus sp. R12_1]